MSQYSKTGFKTLPANKGRQSIRKMLLGLKNTPSRSQVDLFHKEQDWRDNHLDDQWCAGLAQEVIKNINPSRRQKAAVDDGRWSFQ